MAVRHVAHLLEREPELDALRADIAAAREGAGRMVLIEGPAGIGKTALIEATRALAETAKMTVARARGAELERGFAFGIVRQLFEPLLRGCSAEEGARLLSGSASRAGGVLGVRGDAPGGSDSFAEVIHGLYWLALNLAESRSLVALVDDAQWADPPSLRFLSYLAGRLDGVSVLVVAAVRSANGHEPDKALAAATRELTSRVERLRPLSEQATAELVQGEYGQEIAPEFARACHVATQGNPFLVCELLRALLADHTPPTAAQAARVAEQAPAGVARSLLTRVDSVAPAAATVARALAVLGGEAELRDVIELSSLDPETVATVLDLLVKAEVTAGDDPVAFVHPIVRTSIYADIATGERSRAHMRAARMLATRDGPSERVAVHVLATHPAGDRWTVYVLVRAAVEALGRGAPESAVAYLRRALTEPPADGDRQQLLTLLGRAEYAAHSPGAAARLIEAMDGAPTSTERGELALQASKALIMAEPNRSQAAIQILDQAIVDLGRPESQLSMRLEAQLLAAAGLKLATRPLHAQRIDGLYARALGDQPADRLLLGNLALWTLIDGRTPGRFHDLAKHARQAGSPADVARLVARRAIADGQLLREEGSDSELFYLPIMTLRLGDFFDETEYWLQGAIDNSRRRGSVLGYAIASAALAELDYRRGRLSSAEAHARAAAAVTTGDGLAVLLNILIEQGRLEEAQRSLDQYPLADDIDHLLLQPIRAASGRLAIAKGRTRDGIDRLLACGRWLDAWPIKNPSVVPWRSTAALALDNDQERDHARWLAREEVTLAQSLGQPRTLGISQRALGLIERHTDGTDLLQAAVGTLERTPARLEYARALIDYGAAIRRAGHRADARKPLREGLDLAHECGATALAQRARAELLAAGARPRRPAITGRDALTPTEARVAQMAAQGQATREIAQALFVTPKTVETHLGHAYRKLDIHTRAELAEALANPRRTQ